MDSNICFFVSACHLFFPFGIDKLEDKNSEEFFPRFLALYQIAVRLHFFYFAESMLLHSENSSHSSS